MKKYTVPTLLCAGLLLVSASARGLLEWPPFVAYFPYLMWVHVAIIALAFYGFWVLRKAPGAHLGGLSVFARGLPVWLVALALPVAFAVVPLFSLAASSLGTTPDGQAVHSRSWIQEGDRHFAVLNRTVKVEIAEGEYTEAYREMYAGFSSAWILFSYLMLVLWHYNRRREAPRNAT